MLARVLAVLFLGGSFAADFGLDSHRLAAQESPISAAQLGGTLVSLPSELRPLLDEGGVPESLDQLRLLERQQRKVADVADDCTVSVQIGPAQGCGVIITPDGYVLTAAHVAMSPNGKARLTLASGRTVWATTLGMNRNVDAGLIKIDAGQNLDPQTNQEIPWPHATLGSSRHLKPGMWCVATGHPGGYLRRRGSVTRIGRILAIRPGSLVTDCALIGGDSGGPLFDIGGRLIGVHSRIGNDVADNLHVPIDTYDFSWKRLQQGEAWGFLPGFRPVLGVRGPSSGVARVTVVKANSPAEQAGVKVGDIIERFNSITITDFESLKNAVSDTMPGARVRLRIDRGGTRIDLDVEIGKTD